MHNTKAIERGVIWAGVVLVALSVFGLWLTAPTEEDLQRCVDNSNYTMERCKHELTK